MLLVLVLGVGVAVAAYKSGRYTGKTAQRQPITFTVRSGKIQGLAFKINDTCPNGDGYTRESYHPGPKQMQVRRGGYFSGGYGPANQRLLIAGRVVSKTATGTVSDVAYDEIQQYYCRSGKVKFTAKTP